MDHFSIEPLSPILFQLGPIAIHWYAIFILSGIGIALFQGIREGRKMGIEPGFFWDLVTYGVPISIIGARIYFVMFQWEFYSQHPDRILRIWEGGLAIHGALIAAFIFGWFFCKKRKTNFWVILDIGSVGFFIAQAMGRWGNFMNQEAHGGVVPGATLDAQREFLQSRMIPNFVIDNMFIGGNYHHPTFLYESLWNIIGFLIAVFLLRKLKHVLVGEIAAFYAVWYSIGRYFIEGMRTDSLMLTETIRIAQFISIITVVVVLAIVFIRRIQKKNIKSYRSFYV